MDVAKIISSPISQRTLLLSSVLTGAAAALVGAIAMVALHGHLPHSLHFMQGINALHEKGAIVLLAAGGGISIGSLAILAALESVRYFRKKRGEDIDIGDPSPRKSESVCKRFAQGEDVNQWRAEMREALAGLNPQPLPPSGEIRGRKSIFSPTDPAATYGAWGNGKTYGSKDSFEENVAFSYAHPASGFSFTVEGKGMNNPAMHKVLKGLVEKFIAIIRNDLANQKFSTVEEAKTYVEKALVQFGLLFHEQELQTQNNILDVRYAEACGQDPRLLANCTFPCERYLPGLSFALVMNMQGKKTLIGAQYEKSFLVIDRREGDERTVEFMVNSSSYSSTDLLGLGTKAADKEGTLALLLPEVFVAELSEGDSVYTFSSGVGKFLSREEIADAIANNEDSTGLLAELLEKMAVAPSGQSKDLCRTFKDEEGRISPVMAAYAPSSAQASTFRARFLDEFGTDPERNADLSFSRLDV